MKYLKTIFLVTIIFFSFFVVKTNATEVTEEITVVTNSPDFQANQVKQDSAIVNESTSFTADIVNVAEGTSYTGQINYFFQIFDSNNNLYSSSSSGSVSVTNFSYSNTKEASTSLTFPSVGTYSMRLCVDKTDANDEGSVLESNEGNNCGTPKTIIINPKPLPDLTAGVVSPSSIKIGVSQTFSATITNQGNASTGASFPYFFQVSSVSDFSSNVEDLSSKTMNTLGVGESLSAMSSKTFTSAGTYYMRVCADKTSRNGGGVVTESDEDNNCGPSNPTSIVVSGDIDLTVTGNVSPTIARLGQSVTFSSTAINQGTISTGNGFAYKYQVRDNSESSVWDLDPVSVSALDAGASINITKAYSFSSVGDYSMRACLDIDNVISESNSSGNAEDNNCGVWTNIQIVAPDLISGAIDSQTIGVNSSQTFSATITNQGNASTGVSFPYFFQIANDSDFTSGIVDKSYSTMSSIDQSGYDYAFVSHTFTSVGTYYMRVCADKTSSNGGGVITELNEANNCGTPAKITVDGKPNLVSGAVTPTSVTFNTNTTFQATITNSGNLSTGVSFPYFFQIANDSGFTSGVVDKTSSTMSTLGAGASSSASVSHNFTTAGTYYMRVCADKTSRNGGGVITESNEDDNCGTPTKITVNAPDLISGDVTSSDTTQYFGSALLFNSYIKNQGGSSTLKSLNYLFQVKDVSTGNIKYEFTDMTYSVSSLELRPVTFSYSSLDLNPYQVRLCSDKSSSADTGLITESNSSGNAESNNCGAWSPTINVSYIDFQAGSFSPNTTLVGEQTYFYSLIVNNGTGNYYSADGGLPYLVQIASGVDGSGTITSESGTYNGDFLSQNEVEISWSHKFTSVGNVSIRLCADKYSQNDSEGQIVEPNEDNNCGDWSNVEIKGVMSGNLDTDNLSCTITTTGDSCSVPVYWSIYYPESSPTAITYLNKAGNSTLSLYVSNATTPYTQSGTANPTVYYGARNFYLYNNAKLLDTVSVSAYCDTSHGYIWDANLGHCILQTYTVSTYIEGIGGSISPTSVSVSHGSTTSFSVSGDTTNGYVIDSVTGCGGDGSSLSGSASSKTYTTGAITSACTVNVKFRKMTGNITPDSPSCIIPVGSKDCGTSLSWTTTDPIGTSAVTAAEISVNGNYYSAINEAGNSGSKSFITPHGSRTFYLYNNALLLDQVTSTAECNSETSVWNGSVCAPSAGTLTAKGCVIEKDHNSCDVTLEWTTLHPVVTSEVTTPTHITVASANDGREYYNMSCANYASIDDCDRNFYLYNNGEPPLAVATIKGDSSYDETTTTDTISCASETKWNADSRTCAYQPPILNLITPACFIPIGSSTCTTSITWSTEYPAKGVKSVLKQGITTLATGNTNTLAGYPDGYKKSISLGTTEFTLTNGASTVKKEAVATCVTDAHWEGGKCIIDLPNANNTIFEAIPNTVLKGKSATLNWSSSVATSCSIKDGNTGSVVATGISGTKVVTPAKTTTYTLTCTNATGTGNNPLLIKVVTLNIKEN